MAIHVVVGTLDESGSVFDDDCPMCRALRDAGTPAFTIDDSGDLAQVAPRNAAS